MKLDVNDLAFIERNIGQLKKIIESRIQDYLNRIVDETDSQKREAMCLLVKELRMAIKLVIDIQGMPKDKQKEIREKYTGV